MNLRINQFFLLTTMLMLIFSAQNGIAGDGHFHPDSLQTVTVTGTAIMDSSIIHAKYFLDSNGDGQANYLLNFGPWWYAPDSSAAVRPKSGDAITIKGGSFESKRYGLPGVIVYEINDFFWRDPTEPTWDMMGGHQNGMGHHNGMGFVFGWMHDSLRTVELNGSVLADSTFMFGNLYMDTNADSVPDYFLNFGPPWYQPQNGLLRPQEGDVVSLTGGLLNNHNIPMLIVYTLNGQNWRDSSTLGQHFGGGWIYDNMTEGRYFHSPFDSLDGMYIRPGWRGGMGHGHNGMMSDSLFCQILEVFPQNTPNPGENHVLVGYEIAMFNPDGSNNMWMGGMNGGHMNMNSDVDYTLHYTDIQLQGERINENTLEAKYWDDQSSSWISITNAVINTDENTVTFSSKKVSNYVILSGTKSVTFIGDNHAQNIRYFTLSQNYPNPFNPVTTITYQLSAANLVQLTVYNALGQKLIRLVDRLQNAGEHSVNFNASALPSGTYYYELKIGSQSVVRKMSLLK